MIVPRRRSSPPLGRVVSLKDFLSFVLIELATALVAHMGVVLELLMWVAESILNLNLFSFFS